MKGEAIMRRIFLGTGTVVLGLATLMWATAPLSAQHGHGHSTIHGSVHYPVRVAPPVVRGTVHYAGAPYRYAGTPYGGAYRNPYSYDYFRRFRPGYYPFVIGNASYYYYPTLPLGYQTVVIGGSPYYFFNGVYYQPYLYGGQTVYMVVPTQ
jgi:hypothetical protein